MTQSRASQALRESLLGAFGEEFPSPEKSNMAGDNPSSSLARHFCRHFGRRRPSWDHDFPWLPGKS